MTSGIHVTVVLLKQFWKAARESLLILFHPKRDSTCPEHLYALVQRFAGVNASLSDIRDVFLCLVSLARPVILGGVTLISRIRIFLFIFLEVKLTNMVPGQPG